MAERIDGNARAEIEISVTVGGDQPRAFAPLESEVGPRIGWQEMRAHSLDLSVQLARGPCPETPSFSDPRARRKEMFRLAGRHFQKCIAEPCRFQHAPHAVVAGLCPDTLFRPAGDSLLPQGAILKENLLVVGRRRLQTLAEGVTRYCSVCLGRYDIWYGGSNSSSFLERMRQGTKGVRRTTGVELLPTP